MKSPSRFRRCPLVPRIFSVTSAFLLTANVLLCGAPISPEASRVQTSLPASQAPGAVGEPINLRQAAPMAPTVASADPVVRLKLLPPGPDNPRNSEAAFLRLKDGRIFMVYSHFTGKQGADESPCHLAGRYSSDGGKTWTKEDVAVVAGDEAKMRNVMSPSLLRLQDGRIALFYLRLNGPLDDRPIMRVSTDEAQTWGEPRVCIGDDEVGLYILNNDRVIQLKSGRLVLPLARHDDLTKPNKFNDYPLTLCFLSDDGGQTWRRSQTVLDGKPASGNRVALQEPGVVELKDGRLMMFCRTHTGYIYRSFSADGGDTWSPAVRYPGLFAPVSAAAIKRIPKTGDLLLAWNDHTGVTTSASSPYKGKRTPSNVAISRDEGETWENVKTLEADPNGWYCYWAMEFVGNDVLLAHCAGWQPGPGDAPGHETKLALTQLTRFPLSFLYNGTPVSAAPDFSKQKRLQLFLLTGQSNSLGTTEDPDEKDITPGMDPSDASIPFFWSNRSTRAGDGPAMLYGNSGGKIVTLRAQQGEGPDPMFWGPEMGFGRSLAAAGRTDFMIVKASRGGGGTGYWLKGNGDDHMYRHVVDTALEAVKQLPTGTEFDFVGLLYLQGESDHGAEAAVAGERLLTLAENLRKDLPNATALKVLVSGIVPSGKNQDIVRAQQSALPALDPRVRYLDNMEWKPRRYDGAHYVKSAKLELGRRLAKMWLGWPE